MTKQSMSTGIMEYMVWVVELVASGFFGGNKALAYNELNSQGVWDLYVQSYDTTHTLGANRIIGEVRDILAAKVVV